MITPDNFKISYEEFVSIVEEYEKKELEQWKKEEIEDRTLYVQMWITLCPDIIHINYIERLKESYKKFWNNVEIKFQHYENGIDKLYIELS